MQKRSRREAANGVGLAQGERPGVGRPVSQLSVAVGKMLEGAVQTGELEGGEDLRASGPAEAGGYCSWRGEKRAFQPSSLQKCGELCVKGSSF